MKPLTVAQVNHEDCCIQGVCSTTDGFMSKQTEDNLFAQSSSSSSPLSLFFRRVKSLYAAALGIEILCIAAA
jgi:hypothetical protein